MRKQQPKFNKAKQLQHFKQTAKKIKFIVFNNVIITFYLRQHQTQKIILN